MSCWGQSQVLAEPLLRTMFESSPEGVLVLEIDGTVRFANSSAAAMLGAREPGALVGAPWRSLWPELSRPAVEAHVEAAAHGEARHFAASPAAGARPKLEAIISPMCNEAGQSVALFVSLRDVSDIEAARLAAEARERVASEEASALRALAALVSLSSWETDFRRDTVRISNAKGLQELSIEQAVGAYDPETAARFRAITDRVRVCGEPYKGEAPYARLDGARGWLREFVQPILEDGVCVGIRGAAMDISEEVSAREAIQRAERRLAVAAELAGMEVYELDYETQTLIKGGSAASILGGPLRPETFSSPPIGQVAPQDRARVQKEWASSQEAGSPFRSEFRMHRNDGQEIWVYCVAEMVTQGGQPKRLLAAIMDITERKRSELTLRDTMRRMAEHEAHQKLLLDELNHRVKNTLAAVQSMARQTLAGVCFDEPRDLFLERLLALSATHDLLVRHAWESASFHEVADAVLKPYGRPYSYEGSDLQLDPNHAVSLGMALHELATNAHKHGAWREAGRVKLTTEVGEGHVRIVWSESGGPPVLSPTRRGFGSRLLQRGVAGELGAKVALDFAADGLVCTIQAPLSARLRVA
ncbi:PAS domain-containing protein [Phenylobacterium sp. LjRoot225]|uniref:PAS domain-containing protein n=1 Tax=Phenylobacterium sp. LjRoot225 TaxID=3342285 RepID=UPI003ECF8E0B